MRGLAGGIKSPPGNIKEYIKKQVEKKLLMANTPIDLNSTQTSGIGTLNLKQIAKKNKIDGKRSVVQQLRSQNHNHFNQLISENSNVNQSDDKFTLNPGPSSTDTFVDNKIPDAKLMIGSS